MKYYRTFDFTETETQAAAILEAYRKTATPYQRKKYPGIYTPWEAADGKSNKHFVVWTYYRR